MFHEYLLCAIIVLQLVCTSGLWSYLTYSSQQQSSEAIIRLIFTVKILRHVEVD